MHLAPPPIPMIAQPRGVGRRGVERMARGQSATRIFPPYQDTTLAAMHGMQTASELNNFVAYILALK